MGYGMCLGQLEHGEHFPATHHKSGFLLTGQKTWNMTGKACLQGGPIAKGLARGTTAAALWPECSHLAASGSCGGRQFQSPQFTCVSSLTAPARVEGYEQQPELSRGKGIVNRTENYGDHEGSPQEIVHSIRLGNSSRNPLRYQFSRPTQVKAHRIHLDNSLQDSLR